MRVDGAVDLFVSVEDAPDNKFVYFNSKVRLFPRPPPPPPPPTFYFILVSQLALIAGTGMLSRTDPQQGLMRLARLSPEVLYDAPWPYRHQRLHTTVLKVSMLSPPPPPMYIYTSLSLSLLYI